MNRTLLVDVLGEDKANTINLDRIAELCALPDDPYPGEDRLYPTVLPHKWRKLNYDPTGMGFKGIYRSRCGLGVLMSVARQLDGKFWLHVSFSRKSTLPSYADMAEVKSLFIGDDKTALQVFPAQDKHVNLMATTLHLWHCLDGDVTPDFTKGTGSI